MALRWEQRIPVKRAPYQPREHVIRTIQRPGRINISCAGGDGRSAAHGEREISGVAATSLGMTMPSRAGWRMARRAVFATADAVAAHGRTSPSWPVTPGQAAAAGIVA